MSRQPGLFEPEVPIPEELQPAVELWVAYKKEQWRQTYKPLALAQLVKRMAAMGPQRAMAAVEHSMSQPWQGLFEPPIDRRKPAPPAGVLPEDWSYLSRDEQRMVLDNARSNPDSAERERRARAWWQSLSVEDQAEVERERERLRLRDRLVDRADGEPSRRAVPAPVLIARGGDAD